MTVFVIRNRRIQIMHIFQLFSTLKYNIALSPSEQPTQRFLYSLVQYRRGESSHPPSYPYAVDANGDKGAPMTLGEHNVLYIRSSDRALQKVSSTGVVPEASAHVVILSTIHHGLFTLGEICFRFR